MQVTISVFATIDEISDWIGTETARFDLHFALVKYFPKYRLVPFENWKEFKTRAKKLKPDEFWIDIQPINCDCKSHLDCVDKNLDRLAFHLPKMTKNGLREGNLGTVSDRVRRLKIWRSIIRNFKKRTKTGAWVLNPNLKIKGYWNRIHYSPGIERLAREGLQLLPFAGGNLIFIDEPNVE